MENDFLKFAKEEKKTFLNLYWAKIDKTISVEEKVVFENMMLAFDQAIQKIEGFEKSFEAVKKMRNCQNLFFDLRSRKRLPFTDPSVKKALEDSISAEMVVDEMIKESEKNAAGSQAPKIVQSELF